MSVIINIIEHGVVTKVVTRDNVTVQQYRALKTIHGSDNVAILL
jgi:hypothetical protein